jgi:transposase-like protein
MSLLDIREIPRRSKKGRIGRRRRLNGERGRGTLAKEKPPIFGMFQRTGEVVIRMLENVQQVTIGPWIERTIAKGSIVYTDEYDIYSRLDEWGYNHETVSHAAGEFARDDDEDGFCAVHVNTLEGFWSLLGSWLRPHRGISHAKLPLYLGFVEFVHKVRVRGKALLGELIALRVSSPRIPA